MSTEVRCKEVTLPRYCAGAREVGNPTKYNLYINSELVATFNVAEFVQFVGECARITSDREWVVTLGDVGRFNLQQVKRILKCTGKLVTRS